MADIYVDDGGDNSDGSTWAKSYTSIANAAVTGAAAGSRILVGHDHTEDSGASRTLNFANGTAAAPIQIISATRGSDPPAYQAGAAIKATGGNYSFTIQGHTRWYGMALSTGTAFVLSTAAGSYAFDSCTLANTQISNLAAIASVASTAYTCARVDFLNCYFNGTGRTSASPFIDGIGGSSLVHVINPTFAGTYDVLVSSSASGTYPNTARVIFEDADLSWLGSDPIADTDYMDVILRRCKLGTGYTLRAFATPLGSILAENCAVGAISAPPLGLTNYRDYYGTITGDAARYRTGGASDGETPYSWAMVNDADYAKEYTGALRSPPMTRWVAGGTEITVTVYLAAGAALQNDEFWCEISGPDNTASPNQTAKGYFASSRATILATPSNLTADGVSSWSGTGVDVPQKISFTFTPTEPGPITVRCFLAKGSGDTTIYIDPRVEVA